MNLFPNVICDPGGGAFAQLTCPHPGEFANFFFLNAYAGA